MKNVVFYFLVEKENGKDRKPGRKFSLPGPLCWSPKSRGKSGEKNAMKALLRKYPLPSTLIHDLMTLSPTPPDDFFPQIIFITFASSHLTFTGHSIPTSSGLGSLLSLFFFFFFSTWFDQVDTFYCSFSSLYSSLIYCFLLIFWFRMTFNHSFIYLVLISFCLFFFSNQGVFWFPLQPRQVWPSPLFLLFDFFFIPFFP